jgi:lysophospholipase L1-like esterase
MADNTNGLTFLALGDSYTIGEAVEEDDRWPVQLADTLNSLNIPFDDPEIIARTGWRTDELIAAIAREDPDPDYDLVSLLIGVNNQYQGVSIDTYRTEFKQLLETAVVLAGGKTANVLVVSIPDYGYTSFGQSNQATISAELAQYNDMNRELTEAAGIRYVYITDISENGLSDPTLVASDGLHPSGKQYGLWVRRILQNSSFLERYQVD